MLMVEPVHLQSKIFLDMPDIGYSKPTQPLMISSLKFDFVMINLVSSTDDTDDIYDNASWNQRENVGTVAKVPKLSLTMYTTIYLLYMAYCICVYLGQCGGIFRKQLLRHSRKGTHIFPLMDCQMRMPEYFISFLVFVEFLGEGTLRRFLYTQLEGWLS